MQHRFSVWTLAALVLVGVFAGMGINELISDDGLIGQVTKFRDILNLTEQYYVEKVDASAMTEAAIQGMLGKLDPHSVYIPPRTFELESEGLRGKFEGIGISFRILRDTILVMETIGGGPSARIGILANDRIVRINDSSAIGYNNVQVMQRLKGPKGTKVKVTIRRPSVEELLDFEITRDEISIQSVDIAMMVNDEVGYVSLNRFNEQTHVEMERALKGLKDQGMKKLLLDLRFNPGGYLEEAYRMADMFLDGGSKEEPRTIVYTKGRRKEFEEAFYARTGQQYESLPLIILISNHSASASEIVAGAVQDWDRGLIVGETSFGKGLVQRQWKLTDGSALRLTIARYHTPSGRLIQRDYEGKEKDKYQREAFEREEMEGENVDHQAERDSSRPVYRTKGGRLVYGGGGITPDFVIKSEQLTPTTLALLRRGILDEYAIAHLDERGPQLRSRYGKSFDSFKQSFVVTADMLRDLREFVKSRGIPVDEKEFEKDRQYIAVRLKATIARSFWGNDGWYPLMLDVDVQFQKALSLFPEAEKLAKLD